MGTRILFILACLPALAAVEDGDRSTKAEAAATVTVSAEAAPVDLQKTPNAVIVVDAEQIERSGAKTLADLLREVLPGQVSAFGGPGTLAQVKLNGTRDQDTVILLDGVRINDATGLGLDLGRFGLEGIERVEILQGAASTRYGADAHGGVIALYSAGASKEGVSGSMLAGLGTQGIRRGRVAPAFGWKSGWVRASAEASQEEAPTETRNPFRSAGATFGLGQQLGEKGLVTLAYRNHYVGTPLPFDWSADYSNWPVVLINRAYAYDREYSQRSEQLIGGLKWAFTPALTGNLTLADVEDARHEPSGGSQHVLTSRRRQAVAELGWSPEARFGGTLTLDAYKESAALAYPSGQGVGRHVAAALEAHFEPVPALRLVGSVRRQKDRRTFTDPAGVAAPEADNDQTTFKAGANWALAEGLRVYASYGSAFNNPLLYQSLTNFALDRGQLDNEKSRTLQAGSRYVRGGWTLRLEGSRTTYQNIVAYQGNFPTGYYVNGGHLRVQGVEAGVGYSVDAWGLEGLVRSQEARATDVPQASQFQVSGSAGHPYATFGARGHLAAGAFRLDGSWSYVAGGYYYADDLGYVAANRTHFNDLTLAASWAFTRALALTLRGEHLLQPRTTRADWEAGRTFGKNDTYLIPDFPAQRPTATLELRYRF